MPVHKIIEILKDHGFQVNKSPVQPNPRLGIELIHISAKGSQWELIKKDNQLFSPHKWLSDWLDGLQEM